MMLSSPVVKSPSQTGASSSAKRMRANSLNKERAALSMLEAARTLVSTSEYGKLEGTFNMMYPTLEQKMLGLIQTMKAVDPCLPARCVERVKNPEDEDCLEKSRFCVCASLKRGRDKDGSSCPASRKRSRGVDLSGWFNSISNRQFEWFKRTVESGSVDLNQTDEYGFTALMRASKIGFPEFVSLLLEHGVQLENKDNLVGRSALLWAVVGNHVEVASILLAKGAHVHSVSKESLSALIISAKNGFTEMSQVLIEHGAHVCYCDPAGLNALMHAAIMGKTRIVLTLAQKKKCCLNDKDHSGCTPVMLACRAGKVETALALAEIGVNMDVVCKKGYNLLHYAARAGHFRTVLALLASTSGQVCRELVKSGCLEEGNTPLHLAAMQGRRETACLLVRNGGALIETKNKTGLNALDLARMEGHAETAQQLLKCVQ